MRGELSSGMDIQQAVAMLDLAMSGVHSELGTELYDWIGAPKPNMPKPMAVVDAPVAEAPNIPEPPKVEASENIAPALNVLQDAVHKTPIKKLEIPGTVWSEGEPSGVLLVVQGEMPDERCVTLARAMLAAIGLRDAELSWVGYVGRVEAEALLQPMQQLQPEHVLIMGQGPLGVLLGKNLGVEGWHASSSKTISGWDGVVGVTYPLDLLVKQPLFKRLAWQHLLALGDDITVKEGA
jgi:hypothetical protein